MVRLQCRHDYDDSWPDVVERTTTTKNDESMHASANDANASAQQQSDATSHPRENGGVSTDNVVIHDVFLPEYVDLIMSRLVTREYSTNSIPTAGRRSDEPSRRVGDESERASATTNTRTNASVVNEQPPQLIDQLLHNIQYHPARFDRTNNSGENIMPIGNSGVGSVNINTDGDMTSAVRSADNAMAVTRSQSAEMRRRKQQQTDNQQQQRH